ncbi:MAG: MFS transporter [Rhodospirillaceae bacterium]|nr:MFS transporter [Rhodospirillaceae bacterium]
MTTPTYPPARYAWYTLGVICFGYVFAFVDRQIVGLLAPDIQKDFSLNDTQMGLLQGIAFAIFYTIFGIPLGWFADRFNRKWLLTAGMTVWSVMTAACGLAPGFMPLFIMRMGVGVGESTLNPCASSLISDYFAPAKRPRAFGFYVMSTAFAGVTSSLVGGTVIASMRGLEFVTIPLVGAVKPWQASMIVVGLLGLIPALMLALTVREPTRLGLAAANKGRATWPETRAFLWANKKSLGLFLVSASLMILEIYGGAYWHPSLFIRVYGWTASEVAFNYLAISGTIGIFSAYTSGTITNYFKKRGMGEGVWMTAMFGVVGCTIFGALGTMMPTAELALPLLLLKSVFINYPSAAAMTAINELTPNEHRGLTTALYVVLTGLIAQGLGPLSVGMTTDFVFGDPKMIGFSTGAVVIVTGVLAFLCLIWSRAAYRTALNNVTWEQPAVVKMGAGA